MLKVFAPILVLAVLAGCASTPSDSSVSLSYSHKAKLEVKWRERIGEGSGNAYLRLAPAVQEDTLYAADIDGTVRALSLDSGSSLWSVTLEKPISAGVTLAGEALLVVTRDGKLRSLKRSDGSENWQAQLSSEAVSPVAADSERAFVHSVDGRVTAIELADGKQAWSYESAMPVLTVRGTSTPLVLEQLVVVGFASGKVVALDKILGIPRWDVRLASPDGRSELERLVDIDGHPVLENGLIYAASYHGKVAALRQTGEPLWQEDGSSYTSPELALGNLYLTLEDDTIQAFDANTGAKVWQQPALKGRKLGQPTALGSYLLVADNQGYLYVLSQMTGELVNNRLLRPKPLHVNYPNQSDATQWREMRNKHMGIRSALLKTEQGVLVYTNAGDLLLIDVN